MATSRDPRAAPGKLLTTSEGGFKAREDAHTAKGVVQTQTAKNYAREMSRELQEAFLQLHGMSRELQGTHSKLKETFGKLQKTSRKFKG